MRKSSKRKKNQSFQYGKNNVRSYILYNYLEMNASIIIYKEMLQIWSNDFGFDCVQLAQKENGKKFGHIWYFVLVNVFCRRLVSHVSFRLIYAFSKSIISTNFSHPFKSIVFVCLSSISNMYTILNRQSFINTHILNFNSLQFFCFRFVFVF